MLNGLHLSPRPQPSGARTCRPPPPRERIPPQPPGSDERQSAARRPARRSAVKCSALLPAGAAGAEFRQLQSSQGRAARGPQHLSWMLMRHLAPRTRTGPGGAPPPPTPSSQRPPTGHFHFPSPHLGPRGPPRLPLQTL